MNIKNKRLITSIDDDGEQVQKSGVLENIVVLIVFLSVFGFFIKIIFF